MLYRPKNTILNSSGQATVEYVLVAIIVIVIVLGLVFQFNDAFRNYSRNYFGAYLQCLLDNGELPNLGAENSASTCDQEFQAFNIASGRVPAYVGASSNPAEFGKNGSRGGKADRDKSEKNDEPGSASGGNDSDSSGRPSRFSDSSGRYNSRGNLRPQSFAAGGTKTDDAKESSGTKGTKTKKVTRRNSDGSPVQNEKVLNNNGRTTYFEASKIEEEALEKEQKLSSESLEQTQKNKKKIIQQDVATRTVQSVEAEEVSFSNFIRYLLIAALVIAVILFLVGQFMSISKSMEK